MAITRTVYNTGKGKKVMWSYVELHLSNRMPFVVSKTNIELNYEENLLLFKSKPGVTKFDFNTFA